jgi:hypothetical protein
MQKIPFSKSILFLTIMLAGLQLSAQTPRVDARLDTNSILIGDQVDFHIRLQIPETSTFVWPTIGDTLPEKLEVVGASKIDTTRLGDGYMNVEQILTLTAFDSGYYVVKPLRFEYGQNNSASVQTEPYLLNVFSVEVDTTLAIKPIKGPMAAPMTFAEMLPWILGFLALIIAGGLVFYFLINKKQKEPISFAPPKPKIPPHRLALDELEKLRNEKLWQHDKLKDYYTRLTDILRVYIEGRFKITAMEMTSWEIIHAFAGARIEKENLTMLREILEEADMVKFAKYKPLPDIHERMMTSAVAFVRNTANEIQENLNKSKPELADIKAETPTA